MDPISNLNQDIEEDRKGKDVAHDCQITPEEELLVAYIQCGWFVDTRRRFRKCLMVSEKHPKSKSDLKSTYVIRKEMERHLRDHYNMIHPFSPFTIFWNFWMVLVLIVVLVTIPVHLCMRYQTYVDLWVRVALDTLCIVDIVISFNTGYQESSPKRIIMSRRRATMHYLCTWFIIDFVSCINFDLILLCLGYLRPSSDFSKFWPLKLPNGLKVLRILTLMKYMDLFKDYMQFNSYKFKLFKLMVCIGLLLLWTSCAFYILSREFRENSSDDFLDDTHDYELFLQNLLLCLREVTELFLLMEYHPTKSMMILGFQMVCLVIAVVVQLLVVSQILLAVQKLTTTTTKFIAMKQQLTNYVNYKDLPDNLTKRIMNYFNFKYHKSYYKDKDITDTLSSNLRTEINMHVCQRLLTNVFILKNMPTSVMLKLINSINLEIFLPNDIVVKAGDAGNSMFFISSGMVAVYTPSGMEVCHLTDGGNFGEVCMVMPHSSRVATVVAIDYCGLYVLHRKDFKKAVAEYPDLYERVVYIARQRMKSMIIADHTRHRPAENYDFRTPEGISDFKAKLYEF